MNSLESSKLAAVAKEVRVCDGQLRVILMDGRHLSVPLDWFPRLTHGTEKELGRVDLLGGGSGIRWPLLDEDISVENLLAGRRSGESAQSIKRWLASRGRDPA